ncbi:hypothetical protein L486_07847 [Kwoniella mangroviensis CBS 10435]|uniref:C-CAP/cofactor C-like domain-containing protein n=1 Tax=Kwoniella mangroviensis CBS 10435 TaxID=1331196 RepID=A0A1B9IGQ8_9TREE|nr:hypothetical protein L486_07847 [Kwoniella mangroviensis CBS 10435]
MYDVILGICDGLNSSSDLSDLNSKISDLRTRVDQISALIPVYDRVKYDKQLTELERQVSSIRTMDKPKSKFSFNKSKKSSSTKYSSTPKPGISSSSQPQGEVSTFTSISSPNTHTISNLSHRLIRPPKDVIGTYTLSLSNLSDCIIDLRSGVHDDRHGETKDQARLTAVHGKSLERCVVITPVVGGSILLNEVRGSLLVLGCQQFRIHSSSDTTILLHVDSLPVIEHCTKLKFGSYPYELHDENTNLNLNLNYQKVQDFDWPLPTPSPNWILLSTDEQSDQEHGSLIRTIEGVRSDEEVDEIVRSRLNSNTDSS